MRENINLATEYTKDSPQLNGLRRWSDFKRISIRNPHIFFHRLGETQTLIYGGHRTLGLMDQIELGLGEEISHTIVRSWRCGLLLYPLNVARS
jgi:hypothetical protein